MDVGGGDSPDIATLGVRVTTDGIEKAKSEFSGLAESGEAAATKMGAAGTRGATAFSQAFVLEQGKARVAATQYATLFQTQFEQDMARAREGLARGIINPAQAKQAGIEAAQAYNQGLLSQLDKLGGAGLNTSNSALYADLASSLKTVDQASTTAGAGLGRVRQGLVSLIAQTTGTIPVVDRLGASILTMGIGSAVTLGVVGGVALIAGAYSLLTEDSRKAKEEQDKLTASLGEWYDKQQQANGGQFVAQIAAEEKAITQLRAALAAGPTAGSNIGELAKDLIKASLDFDPTRAAADFGLLWARYVQGQKDAIAKGGAEIKAAARQAVEDAISASRDTAAKTASNLSSLIGGGNAILLQGQDASSLLEKERNVLAELQREYGGLTDARAKAFNLQGQVAAADDIKRIADAEREALLAPLKAMQDEQTANAAFVPAIVDGLNKQLETMRAVAAQYGKSAQASIDAARLVGLEGAAREYVANTIAAEAARRDALKTSTQADLPFVLANIDATQRQSHENITNAQTIKDAADAHKVLIELQKEANATADENIAKTHVSTIEFQKMAAAIDKELIGSIARFAERGVFSFRSFFNEVEGLSLRLVATVDSTLIKLQADLAKAIKDGADAQAKATRDSIESYKELQKVAVVVGAAVTGATVGYNVGQYTNSGFNGAGVGGVLGGVSGFSIGQEASKATGVEGLGVWGAVIGGFTGVIGGLLGAAEAHRAAAKAIDDAARSLATNIASYSQTSSIASALLDNQAKHDALILQAQQLASARLAQAAKDGSPSEASAALGTFNTDTNAINLAQEQNAQRIVDDFWAGIRQGLNSLNGPAGAYQNQLAAIEKTYADNTASVAALGGSLDDVTKLYEGQKAAAKRAYDEERAQLQSSLDAREAYARGLTLEGDAIMRRAQEDKEVFDAEQKGYSAVQIAQLTRIQLLEDEATALKRYADAAAALAQNLAAGPQGTLSSANAADLKPLADKYAADLAILGDAIARGAPPFEVMTDYITAAGDAAAIAAKDWQNSVAAINAASSQLQQQFTVFGTNPQDQLTQIAQLYGFVGQSIDQVLAKYTKVDPSNPGGLTNEQIQLNKEIADFVAAYNRANPQGSIAASTINNQAPLNQAIGEREAIANVAHALTEATGNRMADYLASILLELKLIRGAKIPSPLSGFSALTAALPVTNVTTASLAALTPPVAFPQTTINHGDTITNAINNSVSNSVANHVTTSLPLSPLAVPSSVGGSDLVPYLLQLITVAKQIADAIAAARPVSPLPIPLAQQRPTLDSANLTAFAAPVPPQIPVYAQPLIAPSRDAYRPNNTASSASAQVTLAPRIELHFHIERSTSTDDRAYVQKIAEAVTPRVQQALADELAVERLALGNPTVAGA